MSANELSLALENNDHSTTLKNEFLAGVSALALAVAMGAAGSLAVSTPAMAADQEIAGAAAPGSDLAGGAGNSIVNDVDSFTPDFGFLDLDADANETVDTININLTGTLAIVDVEATNPNTLTVTTFMDITSGQTLTLLLGNDKQDGSGQDGVAAVTVAVGTTLGDNGATILTRGGTLAIIGANDDAGFTNALTVGGNTLMTTISVTGGDGGANEAGGALSATFGDSTSADTFDVTGFTVSGGTGSGAAAFVGGASSTLVNSVPV